MQSFCAFFYPHLPIIPPEISIVRIHESSSVLFWTILAISTQRAVLPSHVTISQSLKEPFLRLFKSEILNPPLPLQTIQAITYLAMYPYPVDTQKSDPSWLYSGVGINAAMYMGLHRAKQTPSLRSIGVPAGPPRSRAHTWLGCFLSNTMYATTLKSQSIQLISFISLSNHVGVPAPIKGTTDLATIEYMVRTYPLPAEFRYQVMVYHTLAKFFNTIVENSQENMSQSLVNIIDAELDSLKIRYPTPWTLRVEMNYLTARLLLYTTIIIRLQTDRTTREILMRTGLSVAVRIAYLTSQGLAYQAPEYPDIPFESLMNTLPKNYYRVLIISTAFLIRFFILNDRARSEEQELARNHVAMAQRYLKLGCDDPLDERVRGAMLFEALCRQKPVDLETSKLRVDDRMGASLWYDAITTGHALRDIPVHIEEPSPSASIRSRSNFSSKEKDLGHTPEDLPQAMSMTMDFEPFDFSLPDDLWGDSVWGMFDPIAPTTHSAFTAEAQQLS